MTKSEVRPRVAFQGERGAFSEEAAIKLLGPQIELVPRPTFEAMFAAIGEGAADVILAPVENSLAGSVYRCYDLLLESQLHIAAEVVLPTLKPDWDALLKDLESTTAALQKTFLR